MSTPHTGSGRPTLDTTHAPHEPPRHDKAEKHLRAYSDPDQVHADKLPRNNLLLPRSPLIGRDHEVAAVQHLLLQEQVSLLTLTGPGGMGKTRLALQVAANLLDHFVDGVYFVLLAPITDAALVVPEIARTLGLREPGGRPFQSSLQDYLQQKQLLLVLDNFEQVAAAAPLVSALLTSCRRLKVLVTSRATLHLYGEHEFPVPPLGLPDAHQLATVETDLVANLTPYASVELFCQRALAAKPDFALTVSNAAAVAEICLYLDGLPLAIELAAAKIKLFSPPALLARLQQRLTLLTGGPQDLPLRQRTLRAEIAWSYDLLTPGEQVLFRRLAVFAGSFTPEAAQAVIHALGAPLTGSGQALGGDVLEGIASLMDQNLLRQEPGVDNEPRFGMLETIREYGLEQLTTSGELAALQTCHADYYLSLTEEINRQLRSGQQAIWMLRLEREQSNWRMALAWSRSTGNVEHALRLAAALWFFWLYLGYINEGRQNLEGVLAWTGESGSQPARASVIAGAGVAAWLQGDNQVACMRLEKSLVLARALGNKRLITEVLMYLGWVMLYQGEDVLASVQFEESMRLARELEDKMAVAEVLTALGDLARERGDYRQAYSFFEESLALFQELGAKGDVAVTLIVLGEIVRLQGNHLRARALFKASLAQFRALGIPRGSRIPYCLEELARLYAAEEELAHAACLLGAAEALAEMMGAPPSSEAAEMRKQLGAGTFTAAWKAGRAMSPEQAIDYALALPEVFEAAPPTLERAPVVPSPPTYPAGLTVREVEVLRLLAQGLTYVQIADNLVITRRTVNAHLTSIYGKLGVSSCAAATRFAVDHHLV